MQNVGEKSGQMNGQKLDDIVRDAGEYYDYLKGRHVHETRLDVAVVSLVVWFGSFAGIGLGAFAVFGRDIYYVLVAFLAGIAIGAVAGLWTYLVKRKRGFKFAELGILLDKMKKGEASSEDGLHLMDAMHQAAVVVRKRKLDSAVEYAVIAFALVSLIAVNAGTGALAGVIVYLYFRFEAMKEYDKGEQRYEDSKRELLHSL